MISPEEAAKARARAESEAIWHPIARAALAAGNVPLALSAVIEHGLDVDRIARR